MKKKVFAVILAAAAICGSLSPVYAADSELVLYTWEGMFPQEVLDGFEEETGCKIVYSNFDTDETMLEKVSMAKGGDYDVVIAFRNSRKAYFVRWNATEQDLLCFRSCRENHLHNRCYPHKYYPELKCW